METFKEQFIEFIHNLQDSICEAVEKSDGLSLFHEDRWEREGGGGGRTRIISNGKVFEKGGVNTSVVFGHLPENMMKYLATPHNSFFACGLSLVLHPINPYVPTVHANYRYFELYDEEGNPVDFWFGGGSDLTPYYFFQEDRDHFHHAQQEVCDRFDAGLYPKFTKRCDEYFYNSHRGETRGVGGTFYDYLRPNGAQNGKFWFDLVTSLGNEFVNSYIPIVEKRKNHDFGEKEKYWQEIRRGRYVEFNLLHDKGTLFGLKTKGRTESILMSLPPRVRWDYNFNPQPGSEEEKMLNILRK
ncbi:oxygen-dependent coproporphyrinogen oxidase [Alkalitalea saponilacus]|nr:oxygen-dependent coproporphyrinogen oxidase [Alkalitalea saponilacus]ASB51012.1 coproporphyrinogen III oxidase [Alkalitalea saponilacus]